MTVKELKTKLNTFDDNHPVVIVTKNDIIIKSPGCLPISDVIWVYDGLCRIVIIED